MSLGILDKPKLGPCGITPRPYQNEAIDAVRAEFIKGVRRTMVVLGTGGGKTIIFGLMARMTIENGGRVLILAHTDELINQAVNKLDMLGVDAGIEKADQYARSLYEPDCVVASVQTMKPKRLETWDKDYFSLVIIDECHHSICDTYKRILHHFKSARVVGVTATPIRTDEEDLGHIFQSTAFEMNLWQLMTAPDPGPYLCQLEIRNCPVDIDLRGLKKSEEDFTLADLQARIGPMIEILANAIRQEVGERKTLIYTPQVASAQGMATALQNMGYRSEWVSGDDELRKQKMQDFHAGKLQYMSSCSVLLEGVDVPDVSAIGDCRPSKSDLLNAQKIGRGTRLYPGKENCLVLRFNFLTDEPNLAREADLVGATSIDDEVLDIAQEIIAGSKSILLTTAIRQAQEEHERRVIVRIKAKEREIKYRKVSYNPLDVCDTLGIPFRGRKKNPDAIIHKATTRQATALTNMGLVGAEDMSRARATTMLDYLSDRRKKGLATHKQVAHMIKHDVPPAEARAMKFEEAHAKLDELFKKKRA